MNVDRLNQYCVKLVKRLNVVSRKGKILSIKFIFEIINIAIVIGK